MSTLAVGVHAPSLLSAVAEAAYALIRRERLNSATLLPSADFLPLSVFTQVTEGEREKLCEMVGRLGVEPFGITASGFTTRGCTGVFCHPTVALEFSGGDHLKGVQEELRSFKQPALEAELPLHLLLVHTGSKRASDPIVERLNRTVPPHRCFEIPALTVFEERDDVWREVFSAPLKRQAA